LAHNGVLFLDEFPEFSRAVLETLRQPIETAEVVVSRANAHVRYPCRFMLVAAANPCRCGHLADPNRACPKAPTCGDDYMGRISGPLMDRFDLQIEVAAVSFRDLERPASGDPSNTIAKRVADARAIQASRFAGHATLRTNADAEGNMLDEIAALTAPAKQLLVRAADRFQLSARGYHRSLRVARTIADLDAAETIAADHIAEAISYRQMSAQNVSI
jgi:magnesium chelatase family protein